MIAIEPQADCLHCVFFNEAKGLPACILGNPNPAPCEYYRNRADTFLIQPRGDWYSVTFGGADGGYFVMFGCPVVVIDAEGHLSHYAPASSQRVCVYDAGNDCLHIPESHNVYTLAELVENIHYPLGRVSIPLIAREKYPAMAAVWATLIKRALG